MQSQFRIRPRSKERSAEPKSSRLGEIRPLKAGAYVAEGERIATLIPESRLRMVANFAPGLGRLAANQAPV